MISFTVYGNPKALKRHRTFIKNGHRINMDPSKQDKADFLAQCIQNRPESPLTGGLSLTVIFYMLRPKSHYRTGKFADQLKDTAPNWHTSKPDLDNMVKFVKDALNGVFYKDDSQIFRILASKCYSSQPKVAVWLYNVS